MLQLRSPMKYLAPEKGQFRAFKTYWKFNTYMIGYNTCVGKLCELDALVFQVTNRLIEDFATEEAIHGVFQD